MADYDDTNRGALFINEKKEEGSKQPDYTGTINVDGRDLRLSGWKRESKQGKKYLSLSVSEPQEKSDKPAVKKDSGNDGW
jgi:uncharacterized protein (DUF736 family)